jgi:hypothetical protein
MLFGRRWNCNAFRVLEKVLISDNCDDDDDDDADDQPILAATASKCPKAFKNTQRQEGPEKKNHQMTCSCQVKQCQAEIV